MARRRRKSESDGASTLIALVAVIGGPVWLWHRLGPWRLPALVLCVVLLVALTWWALRRGQRRRVIQRLLDQQYEVTRAMTGTQFEDLTVRLLQHAGWVSARRVGGSGDLGADVIADHHGCRLVVQCKRWDRKKVGSRDMQAFLGTVFHVHRADLAVYVTTSTYTTAAAELAASAGVHLMDGPAVATWQAYGPPPWLERRQPSNPTAVPVAPHPTRARRSRATLAATAAPHERGGAR